jgi:hypothetical protein
MCVHFDGCFFLVVCGLVVRKQMWLGNFSIRSFRRGFGKFNLGCFECMAVDWKDIHKRVKDVLREVFQGAAAVHPEMKSSTSRAIYGVDIMLDASFQPKLLEVNLKLFFFKSIFRMRRKNLLTLRNLQSENKVPRSHV